MSRGEILQNYADIPADAEYPLRFGAAHPRLDSKERLWNGNLPL
jgi:hypothetical protein